MPWGLRRGESASTCREGWGTPHGKVKGARLRTKSWFAQDHGMDHVGIPASRPCGQHVFSRQRAGIYEPHCSKDQPPVRTSDAMRLAQNLEKGRGISSRTLYISSDSRSGVEQRSFADPRRG